MTYRFDELSPLTRWHGTLGLVGFMLRQFEIARSQRMCSHVLQLVCVGPEHRG